MGHVVDWEAELDDEVETDEQWVRRTARREAERQRIPKHGRAYTDLAQQMIARRATAASTDNLERARKEAARRKTTER